MADFKITGVIRTGGKTYTEGDEDALAEQDVDFARLQEAGAIEGDVSGAEDNGGEESIFASPDAEELAKDNDLTEDDFGGVEQSGKTGYTKADVQKVIDALEE